MTDLKSLAHPDWPYTGTPHEWRGFAGGYNPKLVRLLKDLESKPPEKTFKNADEMMAYLNEAVYQKQNFGPELK
jgi:hypothetical protein